MSAPAPTSELSVAPVYFRVITLLGPERLRRVPDG